MMLHVNNICNLLMTKHNEVVCYDLHQKPAIYV